MQLICCFTLHPSPKKNTLQELRAISKDVCLHKTSDSCTE